MSGLVAGRTDAVASWVLDRLPGLDSFGSPGSFEALGLQVGDKLTAGVVYSDYRPGCWVVMNVASDGSRKWLSREFLFAAFAYPFNQLKVPRINVFVDSTNTTAIDFDLRIGFQLEGRLRKATPEGNDLLLLGMLKEECTWLQLKRQKK